VKPSMQGEGTWMWDSEVWARCERDLDVGLRHLEVGVGFVSQIYVFLKFEGA
jgi:hypothetical protein